MNEATSIGTKVPRRRAARTQVLVATALLLALGLTAAPLPAAAAESKPSLSGVVNVNTASRQELQLLPGVGEVRAVAIVAQRKERGGFKQVDDLLEVSGIGVAMLERMRPHLTLTGKTTARRL